jgi:hypothetical protein
VKSCRRHTQHVIGCHACITADVRHDQHVQIAVLIIVALVGWAAFQVTEPAPIDGITQEYRR